MWKKYEEDEIAKIRFRPALIFWHDSSKDLKRNQISAVFYFLWRQQKIFIRSNGEGALANLIPKESLWTIGLRRPDGITSYISKFQDDTMSLEVAEIQFSNLVL